jgi:hypothetical protein
LPLWQLLGGQSRKINVYASGINPGGAAQTAEAALVRGHRALKLKVGFGIEADLANLAALRAIVGAGMLAADANQGWTAARRWRCCRGLPRSICAGWRSQFAPIARARSGASCAQRRRCRLPPAKTFRAFTPSGTFCPKMCSAWFSQISRNGAASASARGWQATS